jgi:hypothetical protein
MRFILFLSLIGFSIVSFAGNSGLLPPSQTKCSSSGEDDNQPMYFYWHYLGQFDVHLNPTLQAIRDGSAGSGMPYYEKPWTGSIKSLCPNGGCTEWTVYPSTTNFTDLGLPGTNIQALIQKFIHHGYPSRGQARIITYKSVLGTQYVYTTDHEATYCGPYFLTKSG